MWFPGVHNISRNKCHLRKFRTDSSAVKMLLLSSPRILNSNTRTFGMISYFKSREAFEWLGASPSIPRRSAAVILKPTAEGPTSAYYCGKVSENDEKKQRSRRKHMSSERLSEVKEDFDSHNEGPAFFSTKSSSLPWPFPRCAARSSVSEMRVKEVADMPSATADTVEDLSSGSSSHFYSPPYEVPRRGDDRKNGSDLCEFFCRFHSSPLVKLFACGVLRNSSTLHASHFPLSAEMAAAQLRSLFPFLALSSYASSPSSFISEVPDPKCPELCSSTSSNYQDKSFDPLWYYVPRVLSQMLCHLRTALDAHCALASTEHTEGIRNISFGNGSSSLKATCVQDAPRAVERMDETQASASLTCSSSLLSKSSDSFSCGSLSVLDAEGVSLKSFFTNASAKGQASTALHEYETTSIVISWIKLLECILLEAVSPQSRDEADKDNPRFLAHLNSKNRFSSSESSRSDKGPHGMGERSSAASPAPSPVVLLLSQQLLGLFEYLYACYVWHRDRARWSTPQMRGNVAGMGLGSFEAFASHKGEPNMKSLVEALLLECMTKVLVAAVHDAVAPLVMGLQWIAKEVHSSDQGWRPGLWSMRTSTNLFQVQKEREEYQKPSNGFVAALPEVSAYSTSIRLQNCERVEMEVLEDKYEAKYSRTKRWHPFVTPELVLQISKRVLVAVKAVKQHPAMSVAFSNYSTPSEVRRREEEQGGVAGCSWPRDGALLRLHQCVLCPFSEEWGEDRGDMIANSERKGEKLSTLGSIAVSTMSCMRFAKVTDLETLCRYLIAQFPFRPDTFRSSTSAVVTAVYTKFLANCGTAVWAPYGSERRTFMLPSQSERVQQESNTHEKNAEWNGTSALSFGSFGRFLEFINTAVDHLVKTKAGSIKEVEEGLVHGCAALFSLGNSLRVRQLYRSLPELRETSSSVAACVALGDPSGALEALSKLGYSQCGGWVYIPAAVGDTIFAVCHLVGYKGTTSNVEELYRALIAFQNKGMLMANYMETVLRGVTLRIALHRSEAPSSPTSTSLDGKTRQKALSPREVVSDIVPLIDITLQMLGDDVNADVILSLIESAVRWPATPFVVPLVVGIVSVLRRVANQHISLLSFFTRVDSSTNHMPFLQYFVLCTIRDGRHWCRKEEEEEVFEHLVGIWGVDGTAVRRRAPSLAPSYKLWCCSGCGRPNSDRFNFCACSALRNGFILCPLCQYGQDERWPVCLSCGGDMSDPSCTTPLITSATDSNVTSSSSTSGQGTEGIAAVVRKSWSCSSCGASNPARQVLLCFRCSKLTGPLAELHRKRKERKGGHSPVSAPYSSSSCRSSSSWSPTDDKRREVSSVSSGPPPLLPHNSSFCQCNYGVRSKTTYTTCIGFCHTCRTFRSSHSKSMSFVWRCSSCQQLRSSLERSCPRCPQVECVPFLFSHAAEDSRYCRQCRQVCVDPFLDDCPSCGGKQCLDVSLPAALPVDTGAALQNPEHKSSKTSTSCQHCHSLCDAYPKSIVCSRCLFRLSEPLPTPSTMALEANVIRSTQDSPVLCFTDKEVLHQTLAAFREGCQGLLPFWSASSSEKRASSLPDGGEDRKDGDETGVHIRQELPFCPPPIVDCVAVQERLKGLVEVLEMMKGYCLRTARSRGSLALGEAQSAAAAQHHVDGTASQEPSGFTTTRNASTASHSHSSAVREENPSLAPDLSKELVAAPSEEAEMVCASMKETLKWLVSHIPTSIMARYAAAHVLQLLRSLMIPPPNNLRSDTMINPTTYSTNADSSWIFFPSSEFMESVREVLSCLCKDQREKGGGTLFHQTEGWKKVTCTLCLGSHPEELCAFHNPPWRCETCGQENTNTGMDFSRYCCTNCLSLRPLVRQLQPSTCWTCHFCQRSNVGFEKYCIFCGCDSALTLPCNPLSSLPVLPSFSSPTRGEESYTTPFLPARCAICQLVYLEPSCPSCTSRKGHDLCPTHVNASPQRMPNMTTSGEASREEGLPFPLFSASGPNIISSSAVTSPPLHSIDPKAQPCFEPRLTSVAVLKHSPFLFKDRTTGLGMR